jgi:L-alanine-DL-glutamate epimerase-like enolase superfamily enzyme
VKITDIEAIPVCVPLKRGLSVKTAHGEHATSLFVLVKVHTDEGLVGLGEATISALWSGETQSGTVAAIRNLIAPVLIGKDPRDITTARRAMDFMLKLNPFTKAAVEMALWDIAGKAVGLPVWRLLGGACRDRVRIKLVLWAYDIPAVLSMADRFLGLGVSCLKVKVGLDPEADVARVRAVRAHVGPDMAMTIDANTGWTSAQARACLRRLEDTNLVLAEQPIPAGDPVALAELRRDSPIPIMADESVFTLQDAWLVSTHRAADILGVYPGKHGGIAGTAEIVAVAKAAGLRCAIGSNLELGVGTAAMLHVAAALPEIDSDRFPADTIGPFYHEDDLLTEPLDLGPPAAKVPDGPGLGVQLDDERVRRWRVD